MSMTEPVGKERISRILEMVKSLEDSGANMAFARRLEVGGEWGLCFKEVFRAAQKNKEVRIKYASDIRHLNDFFSRDEYMAKHYGFPLA